MTFKKISLFFIAALTTCSIQAQQVQLIPEPSSIQIGNGTFKLPNAISIQVSSAFEEIGKSIHVRLNAVTGKKAALSNQKNATIRFEQVQDASLGKEGYQLTVNEKGIQVKAQTYAGALVSSVNGYGYFPIAPGSVLTRVEVPDSNIRILNP